MSTPLSYIACAYIIEANGKHKLHRSCAHARTRTRAHPTPGLTPRSARTHVTHACVTYGLTPPFPRTHAPTYPRTPTHTHIRKPIDSPPLTHARTTRMCISWTLAPFACTSATCACAPSRLAPPEAPTQTHCVDGRLCMRENTHARTHACAYARTRSSWNPTPLRTHVRTHAVRCMRRLGSSNSFWQNKMWLLIDLLDVYRQLARERLVVTQDGETELSLLLYPAVEPASISLRS